MRGRNKRYLRIFKFRAKKKKKYDAFERYITLYKQLRFVTNHFVFAVVFKNIISNALNFLFSFKINFNVHFFIKRFSNYTLINSYTVFNYIKRRIFKGARMYRLLKYVLFKFKKLYRKFKIDGFSVSLTGRLSKKDRATQIWVKHGKFTKSTRISKVDHYCGKIFLKYSTSFLKVNIMKNNYRHRLKKKKEIFKRNKKIKTLHVF